MSATQPYLSVVIPCYNEAANLEAGVLDEVYRYLAPQPYPWEAIIVNDESTDASADLIRAALADKPGLTLVEIPHGGKPSAVWAGIQRARGEIVLFADMDQSTPLGEWDKLMPWYAQGADVVIGSRGTARAGFSPLRKLGSFVFGTVRGLFLLSNIRDTQCGFKSCRREVALRVFPRLQFFRQKERPKGWKVSAYDVELLHLCQRAGYRIQEVVVQWSNRDRSVTKNQSSELARYVRESLDMAREVMRVKTNQAKGLYDDL